MIERVAKDRLNRNQNFLLICCGATGTGKSYASLSKAEDIQPGFPIENVVFTAEEFMNRINSGDLKNGDVLVWDEAGVGIPSKEWYSISNKAINYVFQTFRNMNLVVIMTTPSFDYVDSGIRKLFHGYMETQKVIKSKRVCRVKFYNVTFNPKWGKIYWKRPRVFIKGKLRTVNFLDIKKPSVKLVNAYERKKLEFTKNLNTEVKENIDKSKHKQEAQKPFDPRDYLEQVKLLEKPSIPKIQVTCNLTYKKAQQVRALLQ
jgi:hypothetical protein